MGWIEEKSLPGISTNHCIEYVSACVDNCPKTIAKSQIYGEKIRKISDCTQSYRDALQRIEQQQCLCCEGFITGKIYHKLQKFRAKQSAGTEFFKAINSSHIAALLPFSLLAEARV